MSSMSSNDPSNEPQNGPKKAERATLCGSGMNWLLTNPEALLDRHLAGKPFLAIAPEGLVFSASDYEEFEAKLNDLRPSFRKRLFLTHTSLWVVGWSA